MESLLVHSDGECAVILIIYADHSSLGEQRWGGRERDEGNQSEKHVTLLFPLLNSSMRTFNHNKLSLVN